MHRRTGSLSLRGTAHISPPVHSPMDDSKRSRLNRRSFGVTHRIWLLLFCIVALLTLTHYVLPSTSNSARSSAHPINSYSNAGLHSKNYFNVSSVEPNPFEFCPPYGDGDAVGRKYGTTVLSNSRLNLGSGTRIQRVINRALSGKPITISVLGGSVSACHGAGDDPISPNCYPSKFFKWWNSVFPHPATELTNGAMRRANSAYYGFCSAHHIPDVADLIIIELDTSDSPGNEMMDNFELLVRSLLIRPDNPAILILGHFSPQVHQTHGFAGPDHYHTIVAQFYDIPHITVRPALFTSYMNDPKSISKYYVDPVLASPAGHDMINEILIAYFETQICEVWSTAVASGGSARAGGNEGKAKQDASGLFGGVGLRKGVPGDDKDNDKPTAESNNAKDGLDEDGNRIKPDPLALAALLGAVEGVPPGRINTRPKAGTTFEEIAPYCVSANDLINPLPASLFYGSGWYVYHPPSSGGGGATLSSHYWYSTLPTSKLRVQIMVGAGDVGVYYLAEPVAVVGEGSQVECWVDDNYAGAKTIENAANIGEPTPTLFMIDKFVTRGSHFVECQLVGEEGQGVPMFKILGIFTT